MKLASLKVFLLYLIFHIFSSCLWAQSLTPQVKNDGEFAFVMASYYYRNGMAAWNSPQKAYVYYFRAKKFFQKGKIEEALVNFKKGDSLGSPECKFFMAHLYTDGKHIKKDLREAFVRYRELAARYVFGAVYNLGVFYENGWGTEVDHCKAQFYYKEAVEHFPDEIKPIIALAKTYISGKCNHPNMIKSLELFKLAASKGDSGSAFNAALIIENNAKTSKEVLESFRWYIRSAELGNSRAMLFLAIRFEEGRGIKQNLQKAYEWYMKAFDSGNIESHYRLAKLLQRSKDSEENLALAIQYFGRAAQKGHLDSFCEVALMYLNGEGVEADAATAAKWLSAAVEQKYERAQYLLGLLYLEGKGVPRDKAKGLELIKAAAGVNYPEAVKWLEENQ